MNFSLSMHRVTNVILGPVKVNKGTHHAYATRIIEIETPEGNFELMLFSVHVSADFEGELLQVKS
jgi:hypothetical protein